MCYFKLNLILSKDVQCRYSWVKSPIRSTCWSIRWDYLDQTLIWYSLDGPRPQFRPITHSDIHDGNQGLWLVQNIWKSSSESLDEMKPDLFKIFLECSLLKNVYICLFSCEHRVGITTNSFQLNNILRWNHLLLDLFATSLNHKL